MVICNTAIYLLSMELKSRKIVVRITESQLRWLTRVLIQEQVNKSDIVRNALNAYLIEKYRSYEIKGNDKKSET